jgi:hypothetical protein
MDAVRLQCLLNSAAAASRLQRWDDVIKYSSQALAVDDPIQLPPAAAAKAHYRRAVAERHRAEHDEARADLDEAAKTLPDDPAIRRERAILARHVAAYRVREREVARAMMRANDANRPAAGDAAPSKSVSDSTNARVDGCGRDGGGASAMDGRERGEDEDEDGDNGSVGTDASDLGSVLLDDDGGEEGGGAPPAEWGATAQLLRL